MPRAQIKDERAYQALRREGNSEEKSARIANAAAASSRRAVGARGGRSAPYEEWTKEDWSAAHERSALRAGRP